MIRFGLPPLWCVVPLVLLAGFPAAHAGAETGGRRSLEATASAHYDADFRDRAREYHRPRLAVFLVETALLVALGVWLVAGPAGSWLAARIPAGMSPWLGRLLILTLAYLGFEILRFPFRLFFYAHARGAGLRHDPWTGFLLDWVKSAGIGWVQVALAGLLVLALFAAMPRWGWLPGAAGVGFLAGLYIFVAPLIVDPLFHRFHPLDDAGLKARLLDVARRGGIEVDGILVADASRRTRAVNAYFTGLGRTKRIVLYDTLVEKLPPEEITVVLAHEAGHWKHRHVLLGLVGATMASALGLWIAFSVLGRGVAAGAWGSTGGGDPILALPAYALASLLLLASVVPSNLVSRRMETQADRTSLELTGDPEAFIAGEVRIGRENLSDVLPPAWVEFLFYTHPCNVRRIRLAESMR